MFKDLCHPIRTNTLLVKVVSLSQVIPLLLLALCSVKILQLIQASLSDTEERCHMSNNPPSKENRKSNVKGVTTSRPDLDENNP